MVFQNSWKCWLKVQIAFSRAGTGLLDGGCRVPSVVATQPALSRPCVIAFLWWSTSLSRWPYTSTPSLCNSTCYAHHSTYLQVSASDCHLRTVHRSANGVQLSWHWATFSCRTQCSAHTSGQGHKVPIGMPGRCACSSRTTSATELCLHAILLSRSKHHWSTAHLP